MTSNIKIVHDVEVIELTRDEYEKREKEKAEKEGDECQQLTQ
jgi:hypothetical protein